MHVGYPHRGHCPASAMDGHARILAGNQPEGPHAVNGACQLAFFEVQNVTTLRND